jgi:hypothetical protein
MTQRNLIPILAGVIAFTFGVVSSAEATKNLNSSRSNIYKTAADCTKAGGKWGKGQEGEGCYMPANR